MRQTCPVSLLPPWKRAQKAKRPSSLAAWATTWTKASSTSPSLRSVRNLCSPSPTTVPARPSGDIVEVQLPPAATNPTSDSGTPQPPVRLKCSDPHSKEPKHRGFAFVTYASPADAQDAIDNMDLNELRGRVIKVNIARPFKAAIQPGAGNRAGK